MWSICGSWKKRLIPVLLAAVILCGCGTSSVRSGSAPKGTKEYVITNYYGTQEAGEDYVRKSENNKQCEKAVLDEKGCIHIYATDKQADTWRKNSKDSLDEIENSSSTGNIDYDFNGDYTKLIITAPKGCRIRNLVTVLHQAVFAAELYQVFNGKEDWSLEVIIVNADNGREILKATQPDEPLTVDEALWN